MLDTEEAKEATKAYAALLGRLCAFEESQFTAWDAKVAAAAQHTLRQNLLTRDPETRRVSVNFEPDLLQLLREVRFPLAYTKYSFNPKLSSTSQPSFYCLLYVYCSHYGSTIARLMRTVHPPFDPLCVCHTPYTIGSGNIVCRSSFPHTETYSRHLTNPEE